MFNREFEYGTEAEITKVNIQQVEGKKLAKDSFTEIIDAPNLPKNNLAAIATEYSKEKLIDTLKHTIRDIANILIIEEGIGSHELGYVYNILMDHVREKLLNGMSAGMANNELIIRALNNRSALQHNFKSRPGLIASIVKYRKETKNAG